MSFKHRVKVIDRPLTTEEIKTIQEKVDSSDSMVAIKQYMLIAIKESIRVFLILPEQKIIENKTIKEFKEVFREKKENLKDKIGYNRHSTHAEINKYLKSIGLNFGVYTIQKCLHHGPGEGRPPVVWALRPFTTKD